MTGIDFHFNTPDKVGYACRLLRKAVSARGARVVVVADAQLLDAVDMALWEFSSVDFIAHCRVDAEPALVQRSPVILATGCAMPLPHQQVVVNLGTQVPAGFERFDRLVDIVSAGDEDRQLARSRWRHYADRGYAITRHDFAGGGR
ncbi:MAG: DNA polymerase III subunit chi [Pseudomonadota bacterium]